MIIQIIKTMEIGEKLPEYLGKDQDGNEIKLSDFAGKKLVLYVYPKDSTPGCTNEACNLRDNYERFLAKGYAVVGVSIQSAESHKKFIAKYNLPFPLIADTDKTLVTTLGAYGEKKMYGKTTMGTIRTTFIADENGIVTEVFRARQIKVKEHAVQILGDAKS
jgi:thioredoxin-dependent peroxiredoxin